MKQTTKMGRAFYALAVIFISFTACKKGDSLSANTETTTDAIAVASTLSKATAPGDSIYVVQSCNHGEKRDSILQSQLPSSVAAYLSANYAGYTFAKAFATKDKAGIVTGYVAIVFYNDKPVAIKFDASGNFVKVLEQRQKGDLNGAGWHHGGRFEIRGDAGKDSIALSALPSSVLSYLNGNYSGDTLVKAFKGCDSSIVVISRNNGVYANVFTANGTFIKRVQLNTKQGKCEPIAQSALPASVSSYLSTTYPNYVFKNAFAIKPNGTIQGYVVFIDANATKYAVEFDANGNFVKAKTIQ